MRVYTHMLVFGANKTMGNTLEDGDTEKDRLLAHNRNVPSKPFEIQRANVLSVKEHLSIHRQIESLKDSEYGTLSGTGSTNQCDHLSSIDFQTEIL